MAKKRSHSKYLNPNRYWSNWDPREHSIVWEDNDAFAERRAELEYYRKHPAKANLDILLHLLDNFVQQQEEERRTFRTEWNKLIKDYNDAIAEISHQNEVITQLNEFIIDLNSQIEKAYNQQKIIQSKIEQIQNEKQRNKELASIYRNEVVEAFNLVANDIYYLKFAGDEISAIQYIISRMDKDNLDDGAIQGLAIDALGKLNAIQKMVARKVADYELTYAITRAKAFALKTQFINWRDKLFFDIEQTCSVDMDYWSRGYFSELIQNVENICHNIETAPQSADIKTDELKQMQIEIDQLEKLGADSVSIAYSASANSGQTAINVNKVVDSARGGVLFIDEIYSLVEGSQDSFGKEALNTLLNRIENERDNMVVILAGYEELMSGFFKNNPGLQSRFNKYIHFEDYTANELLVIFENILLGKKKEFVLLDDARAYITDFISQSKETMTKTSGNGRWARNLADKIKVRIKIDWQNHLATVANHF